MSACELRASSIPRSARSFSPTRWELVASCPAAARSSTASDCRNSKFGATMKRTVSTLIAVFLLSLVTAPFAAAGQQPIQNTPSGTCPDCGALERALADAERAVAETRAKLPGLQTRINSLTSQYQLGQANRAALQAKARAGTATASDQASLKSYDNVLGDLAREIDGLSKELSGLQRDLTIQTDRAARFRAALDACKLQPCPPPDSGGTGSTGGGGGTGVKPGTPDIPVLPDIDAIPDCEPCEP